MDVINGIIERCGGITTIKDVIGSTEWAIRKWGGNGIPEKHWAALITLDPSLSLDDLHAANESIRASKQSSTGSEAA